MSKAEPNVNKQLRLPPPLARELERRAGEEGISQNQVMINALEKYLKEKAAQG